ncbi:bifunctional hydroxymethylpyrimidine kinase/phosphomethylpyrimidine kinase [Legionella taurinensis]|uniref:hydroxymethylpyrimidine kinase n=1 Tax=Legionella taurinensis TaxID=70611 RepID=A0A3A5L5T0_9GAMM|nr:bifunctional hydroxymethylpyrimidine kinase/phosphomethylpyrimidine kinase [Legionella taurinensis]MDX1837009.1 bifunctional hydroxymethylpyrimidine kinase/phosphomethylpyrimidine kinase [Legionella taurinensis]PUT41415.1 bifunctional hydroxymethylpyrimidine kinase/phosphomethylpyrimidine kinase [Legionella taurinensis]PUT42654.1 bifunctional hydroxymethylpyrimidine kinase/phosphomethylpyrimidine kinase [Legionella taurinensis]PUT46682.1 bifunctional hydroxymethylpyrimidine kinase/phosphomet
MRCNTLSIAGFDGSGGAGIQADLKTFAAFGCYGMTVLTALPVQNTCGVKSCYAIPLSCIEEQLQAIFEDIRPHSVKIGMLFSTEIIELVAAFLKKQAADIPIVLDPVMVAKSGDPLLQEEAITALKERLIPVVDVITPNLPEAARLTGMEVNSTSDMPSVAALVQQLGVDTVLIKGGHLQQEDCLDFFLDKQGASQWLHSPRIQSKNTHGTGCTLSAAIAAGLAKGRLPYEACLHAKAYLSGAIAASAGLSIGHGFGPVDHLYALKGEFFNETV